MADDSEDGPPVALSFAAGKELTIELSQKQSKEIQRKAEAMKKRRRAKHERNAEQKKAKQMKLQLVRLPQELLEDAQMALEEKDKELVKFEALEKTAEKKEAKQQRKKRRQKGTLETAVLSSGKKVTVKDLQEEAAKPSYSQESAHDFLKNHFFGVRLERTPAHRLAGKKVIGQPAASF